MTIRSTPSAFTASAGSPARFLTGVFAQKVFNDAGNDGALFGNVGQLGVQALACAASGIYAVVLTFIILKVIDATIGLRAAEIDEIEGLDVALHGEEGYAFSQVGSTESAMGHEKRHRGEGFVEAT